MSTQTRIDRRFAELRSAGRAALIPFITAGDPDPSLTVDALHALVAAGADLVELGMPFSDPMADGPVIQHANERAIAKGVGLRHALDSLTAFRRDDTTTPVILMGYMNPIEQYGQDAFLRDAAAAGVDAVLLVDCPLEESGQLKDSLAAHGLQQIFLVAPTTTPARQQKLAAASQGFLYFVSIKGITGAARLDVEPIRAQIAALRGMTGTPVAVGFGVRDRDSACELAAIADAVVIGSALVEQLDGARDRDDLRQRIDAFLGPIASAMRAKAAA